MYLLYCSKKAVEDVVRQHKVCILDIDMQGVKSVRKTDLNPIYIFVKPPSMEVLVSTSNDVSDRPILPLPRVVTMLKSRSVGEISKTHLYICTQWTS